MPTVLPSGSRLAMNNLLARFLAEEKRASSRKEPLAVAKAPQAASQAADQSVAASAASASRAAPFHFPAVGIPRGGSSILKGSPYILHKESLGGL